MTTSQRIKELRLKKNYSQDYIAHELGMCQKTYSNLESGKSKIGIDHLNVLSKIYDLKAADLIQLNETAIDETLNDNKEKFSQTINNGESTKDIIHLHAKIDDLNKLIEHNQTSIQNLQYQLNKLK